MDIDSTLKIKKMISSFSKSFLVILFSFIFSSCVKEDFDLDNLNETIFVRHKNADMPAYIYGNGSEKVFLIILHGGPGGHGLQYRLNTIKSDIEKNNAVVYFDQRGSGNSQGSYSEDEISIDIMAEDVLALAKVLKAKFGRDAKLFLMGHSWGGTLGPAALIKNQEDFRGWINVDGAHDPKGFYQLYRTELKKMADTQIVLGNSVNFWQGVNNLIQEVSSDYNTDDFFRLNKTALAGEERMAEDHFINNGETNFGSNNPQLNPITVKWNSNGMTNLLAYKKGLWRDVSYTNRLPEITIPSLVIFGKHDIVVPAIYAQEAFDHLGSKDKEIFIFENSAHNPMSSEPYLFSNKVIGFINRFK